LVKKEGEEALSKDDTLSTVEWLDERITTTIRIKGQIEAQHQSEKDKGVYGMVGPYSWLNYLVGEVLQVYRILKKHEEEIGKSNETELFAKLLGLAPDANRQELIDAIDDVAPLIADYRRKKRGV
jgi:hypothetical protein